MEILLYLPVILLALLFLRGFLLSGDALDSKYGIPYTSSTYRMARTHGVTGDLDPKLVQLHYQFEAKGLILFPFEIPNSSGTYACKRVLPIHRDCADNIYLIDTFKLTEAELEHINTEPAVQHWPGGTRREEIAAWIAAYRQPDGESAITLRDDRLEECLRRRE